ncbi:MAG: class F sortase, partial [Chloroflexi bacterium]|nr:class F sortase [Chloroflexota bacterium]
IGGRGGAGGGWAAGEPDRGAGEEAAAEENVVRSIEELHRVFGEPPFADVGRMRIPALGIDAPLSLRIVGEDGAMPNPEGPDEVSLYDLPTWPGLGGRPGEPGNAIFAGHVDSLGWLEYAQVQYSGLSVFASLHVLSPGQVIEVDAYGASHSYEVQWVRDVAAVGSEWAEILAAPDDIEAITLITCGGDFNAVDGSYASRVVVRAVKAG